MSKQKARYALRFRIWHNENRDGPGMTDFTAGLDAAQKGIREIEPLENVTSRRRKAFLSDVFVMTQSIIL